MKYIKYKILELKLWWQLKQIEITEHIRKLRIVRDVVYSMEFE